MQGRCQERAGEGGQSSFMVEFGFLPEGRKLPLKWLSAPPNNLSTKPDSSQRKQVAVKNQNNFVNPQY